MSRSEPIPVSSAKGWENAVMLEAFRRLQAQGMQQAIVTTGSGNAPALYRYASVGFKQYNVFRFYTKDID